MNKFYRRLKKSPALLNSLLSRCGLGVIAYKLQLRILLYVTGKTRVQQLLFRQRRHKIAALLDQTNLHDQHPLREFLQFNVSSAAVYYWWLPALEGMAEHQFSQLVDVRGWKHIEAAREQGRGVVLVSHHIILAHLICALIRRRGYAKQMLIIGKKGAQPIAGAKEQDAEIAQKFDFIRQLQSARKILSKSGFVRILPDGFRGDSASVHIDFFGKSRAIKPSFAELAIMTNAAVIPATVDMDEKGRLTVIILPPLSVGDDRKNAVKTLVDGYVEFMTNEWHSQRLRYIAHPTLTQFMQLPDTV